MHPQHTKCTPSIGEEEQESIFRTFLVGARDLEVHLVLLDRILRATTKKGRQLFLRNNVYPRQNPGYAYASCLISFITGQQYNAALEVNQAGADP